MALLLYLYTCIQGRYRPEVMGLFVQSLVGIHMAIEIEFYLMTLGKIELFYLHYIHYIILVYKCIYISICVVVRTFMMT